MSQRNRNKCTEYRHKIYKSTLFPPTIDPPHSRALIQLGPPYVEQPHHHHHHHHQHQHPHRDVRRRQRGGAGGGGAGGHGERGGRHAAHRPLRGGASRVAVGTVVLPGEGQLLRGPRVPGLPRRVPAGAVRRGVLQDVVRDQPAQDLRLPDGRRRLAVRPGEERGAP